MANPKNDRNVDMSPRAVERRLLEMSGLFELCMSLKSARPVQPGRREAGRGADVTVPGPGEES